MTSEEVSMNEPAKCAQYYTERRMTSRSWACLQVVQEHTSPNMFDQIKNAERATSTGKPGPSSTLKCREVERSRNTGLKWQSGEISGVEGPRLSFVLRLLPSRSLRASKCGRCPDWPLLPMCQRTISSSGSSCPQSPSPSFPCIVIVVTGIAGVAVASRETDRPDPDLGTSAQRSPLIPHGHLPRRERGRRLGILDC